MACSTVQLLWFVICMGSSTFMGNITSVQYNQYNISSASQRKCQGCANSEFQNRIKYELNSDDTESNTNLTLFEQFSRGERTILKAALDW
uniref:Uncharacterized protein n=1 Tax=Rhipicephalus appendiculatus TaxID=34631 RepID=A0A131Y9I2_RHIAP